jgi:hypothetical protein
VSAANLRKVKAFWDAGGQVIFTTRLPVRSAEFGADNEVETLLRTMLGAELLERGQGTNAMADQAWSSGPANPARGRAWFVARPVAAALGPVLREALPEPDVAWERPPAVSGGNLSYLHQRVGDRDFFFIANSSDSAVETVVGLRGRFELELWDPHTGSITAGAVEPGPAGERTATRVRLRLGPVRSVFVVGRSRSTG